jgi:chromate transporter
VIALVAAAVLRVGGRVIHTPAALALAALGFGLLVAGVPFPLIIALAGLVGFVAGRSRPALLGMPSSHGDDDIGKARLETGLRRRFVKTLLIWLVPLSLLLLAGGLVAELAGFFTLAALVTFGGAYAVLPFVADAAVNHFGWLTPDDMVAGLALGESTPGPLIMVNTFVGFLAGYNVEGGLAWGLVGATIATLCTFVPSFVFIISGAPLIDRIRTTGAFASTLNGITIAVVGVIAALAVFVARHAAFSAGEPDWLVISLAAMAFVAVVRYRVGVVSVVLFCGHGRPSRECVRLARLGKTRAAIANEAGASQTPSHSSGGSVRLSFNSRSCILWSGQKWYVNESSRTSPSRLQSVKWTGVASVRSHSLWSQIAAFTD